MNNIVTMENQSLGLQGIPNARQLGGYTAADGRKVRRDVLLRTGALGKGTAEDLQKLAEAECGSMAAFVQKRFALTDDEISRLKAKYLE